MAKQIITTTRHKKGRKIKKRREKSREQVEETRKQRTGEEVRQRMGWSRRGSTTEACEDERMRAKGEAKTSRPAFEETDSEAISVCANTERHSERSPLSED